PKVLWGIFVILLLLFAAWRAARTRKTLPITFGILWFFVSLAPSSSFVPLAEVMNHHRTFFPYIGLVMAASWAFFLVYEKLTSEKPSTFFKGITAALIVAFLGTHAYGTYQRNEVWNDDVSLWKDVTLKSPKNGRGLMNFGLTEMRKGNMEVAISYFERALKTGYGRHPYLHINLGVAKSALAKRTNDPKLKQEAQNYLKKAVKMGPGYPDCHYHYGNWLFQNGKPTEAVRYLNKALELSPGHQQAQRLLNAIGQTAEQALRKAIDRAEKEKSPEAYLELSLKYYNSGQYENCISACNTALVLKPDYAEAYNNICSAYNKLKQFEKAIEACERSLAINKDYALAKGNLNWAKGQLEKSQYP
ncbi:MAG: tetratricopeptide repeat protein, partial [Flavobacteriales bacterium]|nr:tetratricopeptide repeat protein [Flavobacteriales bacterium]